MRIGNNGENMILTTNERKFMIKQLAETQERIKILDNKRIEIEREQGKLENELETMNKMLLEDKNESMNEAMRHAY